MYYTLYCNESIYSPLWVLFHQLLLLLTTTKRECNKLSYWFISGLLDIYGFESFTVNSLEQLCINYANERLQHYFIQHYLNDLQAEYAEENIPWQHVSILSDNISCVQLMSATPGIFSLLNEVCHLCVVVSSHVFLWNQGIIVSTGMETHQIFSRMLVTTKKFKELFTLTSC